MRLTGRSGFVMNKTFIGRLCILACWTTICCAAIAGIVITIPIILALIKHGLGLLT